MISFQRIACLAAFSFTYIALSHARPVDLDNQPLGACAHAGQLTSDENGNIYQAEFDSTAWSGSLKKFKTIQDKNGDIAVASSATWDAAFNLNAKRAARKIYTFNAATGATIPFELNQLTAPIQGIFNRDPHSGQQDNLGIERINYLHGERAMESSSGTVQSVQFRKRNAVLGDIINSTPIYAGGAKKNIIDENYSSFFNQYKSRPGTVYIGANDGMLHAFSADSGIELFAYIPIALLKKLPALTDPAYQHDSFMDGKITVSETQISGNWRTVLAAGMGSGARGVFALDVTTPDSFTVGKGVVFEFTEDDDADLGFITSAPVIVKLMTGKNSSGTLDYHYFVLVPAGYNSSTANGDNFLFILSLDKPANSPWILNKNYYKIKTGSQNNAAANALAAPGLVLNQQGATQFAYAGDLQGNLWRFDFSNPGNFPPAVTVFKAVDGLNQPQAITVAPALAYAPGGGYVALFGTGKYIENSDVDPSRFTANTFYAVHDALTNQVNSRNELVSRKQISASKNGTSGYNIVGADFKVDGVNKNGWFIDFLNSKLTGERVASEAIIKFGSVFFNTFTPSTSCQKTGSGNAYKLDLLSGKAASADSITAVKFRSALPVTPLLLQSNIERGERNSLGQRNSTYYYSVFNFNPGTDGGGIMPSDKANITSGRLSWRELPTDTWAK